MATKFVLDRTLQAEQKIVEQVLEAIKKEPYPDRKTQHLATFVHALFQAGIAKRKARESGKLPALKPASEEIRTVEIKPALRPTTKSLPPAPSPHRTKLEIPTPKKEEPHLEIPRPSQAPQPELMMPPPGLPLQQVPQFPPLDEMPSPAQPYQTKALEKKEYVVSSFNTPIGVVIDYDEFGKLKYNLVEPQIYPELLAEIKERIKKDFQKNSNVLDNLNFLKENAEKVAKKLNLPVDDLLIKALQYHLKRDLLGFRRIDALMQDINVSAIYVDGINKPVIIDYNGPNKLQTSIIFTDPQDLNVLLTKLARVTGNVLDDDHPILDTVFEGFRIQAVKGVGGTASRLIIKKIAL